MSQKDKASVPHARLYFFNGKYDRCELQDTRPTKICQMLILGFQVVGFFLDQVSQLAVMPLDLLFLLLMPLSPAVMLLVLLFNFQKPLCVCENSSGC